MPSQLSQRPLNSPVYGANTTSSIKVDRGDVLRKISLELKQQPTVTTGNSVVANVQPGDDWAALSRVVLRANGSDVLFSAPGQAIPMINYFLSGGKWPQMAAPLGDGATANPVLDTTMYLDFEPYINAKPSDTWLWTQPLTALDLDFTYAANAAAVVTGATAYTANPNINVNGTFTSLGFKQGMNASGQAVNAPYYPPVGMRIVTYSQVLAGANPQFRFNLDSGRFSYRSLIIQATTTANPAVDTGGLFTNFKVVNGSQTYMNVTEPILNSMTYQNIRRPQLKTSAGIVYNATPRISASSSTAGWYHADFCTDGRLQEAIPTNNTDQFYAEFNIASACTINIFAVQLLNLTNGNPIGG